MDYWRSEVVSDTGSGTIAFRARPMDALCSRGSGLAVIPDAKSCFYGQPCGLTVVPPAPHSRETKFCVSRVCV
jgi:hypothetical protein